MFVAAGEPGTNVGGCFATPVSQLPKTERMKRAAEQQSAAKLKAAAAKKKRFERIAELRAKHAARQAEASNVEDSSTKAYEEGDSPHSDRSKRDYYNLTSSSDDEDEDSSSSPLPMVMDGHMKMIRYSIQTN